METKLEDLKAHFFYEVLTSAAKLQPANDADSTGNKSQLPDIPFTLNYTPEEFGEELLTCISDLPAVQVKIIMLSHFYLWYVYTDRHLLPYVYTI